MRRGRGGLRLFGMIKKGVCHRDLSDEILSFRVGCHMITVGMI